MAALPHPRYDDLALAMEHHGDGLLKVVVYLRYEIPHRLSLVGEAPNGVFLGLAKPFKMGCHIAVNRF